MKKLLLVLFTSIAVFTTIPFGLTSCTKTVVNYDTTVIVHNDTTLIRDTIVGIDTNLIPSPYYVKANVNGVNVSYTNYTAAVTDYGGGLGIYGFDNPNTDASDGIELSLYYSLSETSKNNGVPIPGTYTITTPGSWIPFQVYFADVTKSGIGYTMAQGSPSLNFTCIITTINSVSVSGTFSGTVYSGTTPETVTNGSFYVPF